MPVMTTVLDADSTTLDTPETDWYQPTGPDLADRLLDLEMRGRYEEAEAVEAGDSDRIEWCRTAGAW